MTDFLNSEEANKRFCDRVCLGGTKWRLSRTQWPVSQSEVRTSLGQGDGRLGCGFSLWEDLMRAPRTCSNPRLSGFTQLSISPQYS